MRGLVVAGLLVIVAACNGPSVTPVLGAASPTEPVAVVSASPTPSSPAPSGSSNGWTSLRWTAPALIAPYESISDGLAVGGTYVAVGQVQNVTGGTQAAAWVSTDWRSWTRTLLDLPRTGDSTLSRVLRLGSDLVAVGSSGIQHCLPPPGAGQVCSPVPMAVWTSTDGRTWRQSPTAPSLTSVSVAGVAAGSGGLVLVGDTGWDAPGIWTSPDGRAWRRENLPPAVFAHAHFSGIAAGPNGLILTGGTGGAQPICCAGSASATTPAAWTSIDGAAWQVASVFGAQAAIGDRINQVFVGRTGVVAPGWSADSTGWMSTTGGQWSPLPEQTGNPVLPLTSDGQRILGHSLVGRNGVAFWLSGDGVTWQSLTMTGQTDQMPGWSSPGGSANAAYLYSSGVGLVGENGSESQPLWFAVAQ